MVAESINGFMELSTYLSDPNLREGCFVDTSVLFSATYPSDLFNDQCEQAFSDIAGQSLFTNVNVRAEFLEHHRRVLIAECLIDLLEDEGHQFDGPLLLTLQKNRATYRERIKQGKSTKMELGQIKIFRALLSDHQSQHGDGWELFCRDFLYEKLAPLWRLTEQELGINFISTRMTDNGKYLNKHPEWEGAVRLMGLYGIGSSDAMIVNMFLCSKLPMLLTADLEMAACAAKESQGTKRIFVPDTLLAT